MGGKAIGPDGVRLRKDRFFVVRDAVLEALSAGDPRRRFEATKAYAEKRDFGDLDILFETTAGGPLPLVDRLRARFEIGTVVRNGPTTSLALKLPEGLFQVDLVSTPIERFDFTARYYAFNDLGNLIGRIAHRAGFSFGHDGFHFVLRDPEARDRETAHIVACIGVTLEWKDALQFLGFDADRYETAYAREDVFRNLEDIFAYAVSTPYSNPAIYAFENVNYKARIRDAKRPTYTGFLAWLRRNDDRLRHRFDWSDKAARRHEFLERAFAAWPDFRTAYDAALARHATEKARNRKFNGGIVRDVTGLSGAALGEWLAEFKARKGNAEELAAWIDGTTEDAIRDEIAAFQASYGRIPEGLPSP